jgi:CDP-diglyceride synthetase
MGLAVTCWVFSGNYIFTGLFTLVTALGQLEYYRMVMNTGVFPARRISVIGACSMFLAALFTPDLHQILLPMTGIWSMIWFLTMRRTLTPIPEIATTFTGLFYLGYVPSFWVRIRILGRRREPTRLAPIVGPMLKFLERQGKSLPEFIPQVIHVPITSGATFIFWTWLALAFSDVGAYFVGRAFGKTKLGSVFPAAGATSPNKTVEGALGGFAVSALLSILGAWVQRWPRPIMTGAFHGLCLGFLGLLGDLTASMLKRDAGLKDFGDLLPEHGGVLDRVDSFIWAAPYS